MQWPLLRTPFLALLSGELQFIFNLPHFALAKASFILKHENCRDCSAAGKGGGAGGFIYQRAGYCLLEEAVAHSVFQVEAY